MQINAIEYFENGALRHSPSKVAVKDPTGEYTFAQVACFAKNLAALLVKHNGMTRRPVPVFLAKSVQSIVANIGVLYSGNGYANLDVKSPAQRLKGMLDNMNPDVIIT